MPSPPPQTILIYSLPFLPPCWPAAFPPSPRRQGWIPTIICTIQPWCLLATTHGSFNFPLYTLLNPFSDIYIYNMIIVYITCVLGDFFWVGSTLCKTMGCYFTRHSGLELSHHINAALEADKQSGEVVLSGCIALRSSRCTRHTHTHTLHGGRQDLGLRLKGPRRINLHSN